MDAQGNYTQYELDTSDNTCKPKATNCKPKLNSNNKPTCKLATWIPHSKAVFDCDCAGFNASTGKEQYKVGKWKGSTRCMERDRAVDCVGSWGAWGDCQETCGGGTRKRTYNITTEKKVQGCSNANGEEETGECNTQGWSVDCVGQWQGWGQCDCNPEGGGTKSRTYTITTPAQNGGQECADKMEKLKLLSCNACSLVYTPIGVKIYAIWVKV